MNSRLFQTLFWLFVLLLIGLASGDAFAQSPITIPVGIIQTTWVYTGPGMNAGYLEYVGAGREAIAAGRNIDASWIEINLDGQIVGWVPTATLRGEGFENLPIKGGLLAIDEGTYSADNPLIRAAEIELILVHRPMRFIGARWFRMQGFVAASCQNLPTPPSAPNISAAQIARLPELETIKRELGYVADETAAAIRAYQGLCAQGQFFSEADYFVGLNHLNNAYNSWNVVRRYIDTLTGLVYVAP